MKLRCVSDRTRFNGSVPLRKLDRRARVTFACQRRKLRMSAVQLSVPSKVRGGSRSTSVRRHASDRTVAVLADEEIAVEHKGDADRAAPHAPVFADKAGRENFVRPCGYAIR